MRSSACEHNGRVARTLGRVEKPVCRQLIGEGYQAMAIL
jgi:hypothetical protein